MPMNPKAWKAEIKFFMANERTLMSWLRVATTIGIGGLVSSMASGTGGKSATFTHGWSGALIALAAVIIVYAYSMHNFRTSQVRARHMGSFHEPLAPAAIAIAIACVLAFNMQYLLRQPAVGCLELPLVVYRNATPPFFYVSFHGTAHLRHDCSAGIGGIHRFTPEGHYAGMATNQLEAQMLHPRGMVRHDGMLFVADSWLGDSSVAAFGPCVGASSRQYLGRIRPTGNLSLVFSHPYGLANSGDNWLFLSTQNGGAVIAIDIHTSRMYIDHVVVPPTVIVSDDQSGPLRGLAVDNAGCKHVADKRDNKLIHICPGQERMTKTKIYKPIALFYEPKRDLLFVSSLRGVGEVVVFDLKENASLKGSLTEVQSFTYEGHNHFTGMHVSETSLFVLEQKRRAFMRFSLATGAMESFLFKDLPDMPEGLLYVEEAC
ncbi:hypothetical protein AB1Y20_023188 [Prymnesium parvum]|uniref:DUF202 domain-containing protein n=1 Tax=Prymnesium parvum TaxID=97485 RepID=A0AB34JDZ3_PRYPA